MIKEYLKLLAQREALVSGFFDLRYGDLVVGLDFGVNLLFSYPPCNELVILSAEIQD